MTGLALGADPVAQALVAGDLHGDNTFTARVAASEFPVGGPDGSGGTATGPNPYDLLSASLAACTAITIRLHARHKKYPLSHVEVAVSYYHAPDAARGSFQRVITLRGGLNDDQRAQLLRSADSCPVGRTLGLSAEIQTSFGGEVQPPAAVPADYAADLGAFSIVNIDPD